MFDFSKRFEDNTSSFTEQERKSFESAIENHKHRSLFEIRETDKMIEYLEIQPRFIKAVTDEDYDTAFMLFRDKLIPAWYRTAKLGKLNISTLYSIYITMIADAAVQCGVPYNIAYIQAYIYLLHLSDTHSNNESYYVACHALFEYFRMIREFHNKGKLSDIVTDSLNYIQTHLHQKLTLTDIASYVNISPRQLTRKFKAEVGQTIIDYINCQRIYESEYMLKHSDAPITDIALSIGFSSESYYIDVFKSVLGITPNAYRKKLSES